MKKFLLLSFAISIAFVSCGPSKKDMEIVLLKDSIERLHRNVSWYKDQVEGYKQSPEKLLATMQLDFDNKNYSALGTQYNTLIKYHPESKEAPVAKKLVDRAIDIQNKEAEAKRLAEEKKREKERQEVEQARKKRLQAVNKLKKSYDDVDGITWYRQPYFTHYNNRNLTSIYIGHTTTTWLRLKMSYRGDDWIFFENAYLSYDGKTKEIPFDRYRNKETDNSGGEVWEWIDVSVTPDILSFLKEMVNGKSVKMRLSGKYTRTRDLSKQEIQGIKDVLLAYDVLENGM